MANKYKQFSKATDFKDELFIPQAQFDFHEFSELLPYQIDQYYEEFINDCVRAKLKRVLIITGKGRVVRPHVERLLKKDDRIERYKSAGYYTGQEGAFEGWLKS